MKNKFVLLGVLILTSCGTLTPQQQSLGVTASEVARAAVLAAATTYAGPQAAVFASYGLDALASVLQKYVGFTIPTSVVIAAPGIPKVGAAVVQYVPVNRPVTQADVTLVTNAAVLATRK